jgi:hypothetical protein
MPKYSTIEIIRTGRLEEHPAIKAWRVLELGRGELQGIEILQEAKKSRVYRIVGAGLGGSAVIAKQRRYRDRLVERTIYEAVLPHLPLPRLHYYGFVQADDEYCWLFFEDAGREFYAPRMEEHRLLAARWLGVMHTSAARIATASQLPDRGPSYYLARLQSAHAVIQRVLDDFTLSTNDRIVFDSIASQCDLLQAHWSQLEQMCESIPRTVVHGDFVQKNIRVRLSHYGLVLLPFDWETAGWGLPTIDLWTAGLIRFVDGSTAPSASPEISCYRSIVNQFWPQLDVHDVRVLANLGIIFRQIDAIDWACEGLAYERADRMLKTSVGQLRCYQDWDCVGGAIQAVKWGS